MQKAKAGPVA